MAEPANWRAERAKGIAALLAMALAGAALWYWLRFNAPLLDGMTDLSTRLGFAIKCAAVAVLFTLLPAVEAVAHERLQSPAFDPLGGHETARLRVNQRNLQNTLEQTVIFLV